MDIGYTTQNSAILLFGKGENPYQNQMINVRPELKPAHRGFHYGPGMLIGYFYSAMRPNVGFKVSNLIYFLLTLQALVLLADNKAQPFWQRVSTALFVITIFLLPERLWYETFLQGANDIFPVMLLLYGLVMVTNEQWFLAGAFMGFSFATKFAPAAFLLVLFLRADMKISFFPVALRAPYRYGRFYGGTLTASCKMYLFYDLHWATIQPAFTPSRRQNSISFSL